jgi:2',3'-cyclic-nucleotide 2'-phosphodiesterase/3'-nucleotidase
MKHNRIITFLLIALSVMAGVGCSSDNGEVTIKVVSTSDIHGRIFDKDCLTGEEREGSMAKFSTFLGRVRKENKNVIYLDAGDMLQGSVDVYQDVTAQYNRTSLPAEAFNYLECFATVLGNHDFAVGVPSYGRFFRGIDCPVLGANVYFEKPGDYLPPYRMREIKGVRIAILGMSTPLSNLQQPKDRRELDVTQVVDAARYWVPILKEKEEADVVIGLFHSGYEGGRTEDGMTENAVRKVLSEVPGFNLIICGHDHRSRCIKTVDCNGDSVVVINTGPFMTKAGVTTLTVTGADTDNPVIKADGELFDITAEVPDKRFIKKFKGWYDDVKEYTDSVLVELTAPLEAKEMLWGRSSLIDMLHYVQMGFNSAEISLVSPGFTKPYFPAGPITLRDMFDVYSSDYFMVSVDMKGSEVKKVLENSATQYYNTVTDGNGGLLKVRKQGDISLPRRGVSSFFSAAGIRYEIDVTKPEGERVRIISMSDGKPFDPDKMYRTTINSNQYTGTTLPRIMGITTDEMRSRFNRSSAADTRFYLITALALANEGGQGYEARPETDWKLVPQDLVSSCLAVDTVGFNIMQ